MKITMAYLRHVCRVWLVAIVLALGAGAVAQSAYAQSMQALSAQAPSTQASAQVNLDERQSGPDAVVIPALSELGGRPVKGLALHFAVREAQQLERHDGPPGIADMFIGSRITPQTVSLSTDTGAAASRLFTAMPSVTPASGPMGTVFNITLGSVNFQDATFNGTLMLDGVDVTAALVANGAGFTYESVQAGALIWQVQADDPQGGNVQSVAMADVVPVLEQVVDLGGVQVTVTGTDLAGTDATGRAYIVVDGGASIDAITPDATLHNGDFVGGTQVNPVRTSSSVSPQGYDGRTLADSVAPNYDPNLSQSTPFSVSTGDRLVKALPATGARVYGAPLNEGYRTLHVVSEVLPQDAALAPSVGWAGRAGPDYFTVDMPALMARLHNFSAADLALPPFATLMASLDRFAPVFAQNSATYRGSGYEPFMPPGIAGRIISGNPIQYGRDIAEVFEIAAVALHYDAYTSAQKEQLLWVLIRHGVEWGFPVIGSGYKITADGGHQQFWQFATLVALIATGREAEIATFMAQTGGGNWDQFFEITPDLITSDFSPHSSNDLPQMWRLRTLGAQPGGAVVRVPMSSADRAQTSLPAGASVVRGGQVVGYTTAAVSMATSGTVDVSVDVAPVPAFAAGDVISFGAPAGTMLPGRHDWLQRPAYGASGAVGGETYFSPAAHNQYRALQRTIGQMMSLRGLGYMHPSFSAVWGYIKDAVGNPGEKYPDAANDYGTPLAPFEALDGGTYTFMGSPYRTQLNAFDTMAQVYDVVPADPITVSSVVNPGTQAPGPLIDGQVIGLIAGQDVAPVSISGTAGADSTVQLRIVRQSDDTEVVGWFAAKPTANGTFNAVVDLPRADGWWRLEMRYAGGATVYSDDTRWAVGYKFLMLGQSQMTILLKSAGLGYQMAPAHLGSASYYSWQDHNLGGISAEGENLRVLETGNSISDGLAAFVDQFRVFDPVTPIQLVRESVNGTSVLDFTDDGQTARMWSDLTDKTDKYGADITAVLENWNTANQGALEGHEDIDILQGFDRHLSEHGTTPDHSLRDTLRPGYVYATMPATRNSKVANDVGHSTLKITHANTLGLPVGVPMGDYEIDDSGGPHPLGTGQGNVRFGARLAILAARAVGLATPANPHFAGTATRSTDGTYIDMPVVLANGGALYSQTPNDLAGFTVNENGAGYSGAGFTAAIEGTDVIRLTKDTGTWASAPLLTVRRDPNMPLNTPFDRTAEQAFMAGELYETVTGDITGLGLPVYGKVVDGKWTLQGAQAAAVEQEAAGDGGAPSVSLLKAVNIVDTVASTNNRSRVAYGVLVEDGQPVPDGTEVLLAAFHSPDWGGATDFTAFSIRDSAAAKVGTLSTIATEVNTPGGYARSVRAFSFAQTGVGLDFRAYTNSRKTMTSMLAYKLDGVTLAGAITATGNSSATLENVPAGSTIVAFGQASQPIGWNGLVEDSAHVAFFKGVTRHQAVALGTGEGTVSVTATGATELVIVALPPV